MPSITVVIPAYNASKYLDTTVTGVIDQTIEDWEIVLVDDGSTDSTLDMANAWSARESRIRVLQQQNSGVSVARNAGFAAASVDSKYIIFLDADDVWEPDCLAILYAAAEESPQSVGAAGRIRQIDADGNPIATAMRAESVEAIREVLVGNYLVRLEADQPTTFASLVVSGSIWTPGSILVRLAALRKTGGFDTTFWTAEDNDLWLRLSRLGDIRFVDKFVINYRHHENMKSGRSRGRTLRAMRRGLQNAARSADNTPEQSRMICRSFRAVEWRNAKNRLRGAWNYMVQGKVKDCVRELKLLAGASLRWVVGPRNLSLLDSDKS